jgi:hypothetical protein
MSGRDAFSLTQLVLVFSHTGFFAYHAVPTNFDALAAFRCHIMVLWMRGECPVMGIPTAIVGTITAYRTHRSRDRLAVGCSCQPQPPRSSPADDNGELTPALASLFQGVPDRGMAHHYSGILVSSTPTVFKPSASRTWKHGRSPMRHQKCFETRNSR